MQMLRERESNKKTIFETKSDPCTEGTTKEHTQSVVPHITWIGRRGPSPGSDAAGRSGGSGPKGPLG